MRNLLAILKSGAWYLNYKYSQFVMAYRFLKKMSARLKCLIMFAVAQLWITTVDLSNNDPNACIRHMLFNPNRSVFCNVD